MKSLMLSVMMVTHFANADLRVDIPKASRGVEGLNKMSNEAGKLYKDALEHFFSTMQYRHSVVKGTNFNAKDFSVLQTSLKDERFVSQLHSTKVGDDGSLIKVVADIPSVNEAPKKTAFVNPDFNGGNGNGVLDPVVIRRTFDLPYSREEVQLEQSVLVKKLEDGEYYSMIPSTKVTKGNDITEATLIGGKTILSREIGVKLVVKNPADPKLSFFATEILELPAKIKGQVVTVNINSEGNRLAFTTTEGMEYTYGVGGSKGPSGDKLHLWEVASQKIVGGKRALQAKVKIIEGRNSKPVQGLDTEPIGSVGSAR